VLIAAGSCLLLVGGFCAWAGVGGMGILALLFGGPLGFFGIVVIRSAIRD
jgi:hypothetical protein